MSIVDFEALDRALHGRALRTSDRDEVLGYLRRLLGQRAEDAWQETFLRALRAYDRRRTEELQQACERLQKSEALLRESADRFRFLAESMPQKIFTARPNGEVDYFNRQWTEFFKGDSEFS